MRRGHKVGVLTLYPGSCYLEDRLRNSGAELVMLAKRGRWDVISVVRALRKTARSFDADVVYSFLPTANVVSSLFLGPAGSRALVWGVRSSSVDMPHYDWLGRLIAGAERRMARVPDMIIANSLAGRTMCMELGFPAERLHVVRNIIDCSQFQYRAELRTVCRIRWGVPADALLIGAAGRLDPIKGIEEILQAISMLRSVYPSLVLVIAGDGDARYETTLRRLASRLGVSEQVRWLGRIDDMTSFYSGIDIFCLASHSEGTSNVLAEALACGRICVATRVGDSTDLVADERLLAEAREPESLRDALSRAIVALPDWDMDVARQRILEFLSPDKIGTEIEHFLKAAVARRSRANAIRTRIP